MITRQRLLEVLEYHSDTGNFTRRQAVRGHAVGTSVGTITSTGYWAVVIDGKRFKIHRLVWFLETGFWPKELDHKNQNKLDNRFENLREVTRSQNMHNRPAQVNNTSGVKGVTWCAQRNKWQTQLVVNGVVAHFSRHTSKASAVAAYLDATRKLG